MRVSAKSVIPVEPRWARRKDERPQELIAAALELFVEKGFAATRLDDVARMAGVSKGTLYLYFDSKEALFKAVISSGFIDKYVEAEADISQFPGSSAELMRLLIRRWWYEIGSTKMGGIVKLMTAEAGNFPELAQFYYEEVILRGLRIFDSVIQRGIERGEFRKIDMQHIASWCAAPMLMLSIWRHSYGPCCENLHKDPEGFIEAHIDWLLAALAAPTASVASKRKAAPVKFVKPA